MQNLLVAVGVGSFLLGGLLFYRLGKWRGRSIEESELRAQIEREQSRDAHSDAVERTPPVEIGELITAGVKEFRSHHSGSEQAVCKKEGFVIFVEDCPPETEVGDRIEVKITSYGANRTSAEAVYRG